MSKGYVHYVTDGNKVNSDCKNLPIEGLKQEFDNVEMFPHFFHSIQISSLSCHDFRVRCLGK